MGVSHSCVFYPCDICGKQLNSTEAVTKHKRRNHSGLDFKCQFCEKNFYSKEVLRNHLESVHGEKIPCHVCGAKVAPSRYSNHLKRTHGEKSVCDICNKEVKSLKFHKLRIHP